jgi:hypothetical protein
MPVLCLQLSSICRMIGIKQWMSVFFGHNVRIFLCNMNQRNTHFLNWYSNSIFQFLMCSACFEHADDVKNGGKNGLKY